MHSTPLLVDVSQKQFEQYVQSLSRASKRYYRSVTKRNADLEYVEIDFDPGLIRKFMQMWELQEISGGKVKWSFSMQYLNYLHQKRQLLCFVARKREKTKNILSLHFVENYAGYVECHAPLYDKGLYLDRSIAKYMLFNLIKYAIENPQIKWLDLGGGNNGNWKDLLIRHSEGKTQSYKWLYVPKTIKKKPSSEKPYVVKMDLFRYNKYLTEDKYGDNAFVYRMKRYFIIVMYYNKGRRIRKILQFLKNRLIG